MDPREIREPGRSEAGETLVEVLLALVVIALTSVAILSAFATSISATSEHRTLATADSVLRSFAETFTYDVRLAPKPQWVAVCSEIQTQKGDPSLLPSQYANIVSITPPNSPVSFNTSKTAEQNGYRIDISDITPERGCGTPQVITARAYKCSQINVVCQPTDDTFEGSFQFVVSEPDRPESAINAATYGLAPTSAPAGGGGTITVTASAGTPFANATTVNFGSTKQPVLTIGGGGASVTATIPPESASQYQVFVSVTTPSGTTAAGPSDLFTYGPTVTNISPNTGPPIGGTAVTITGSGFTATSSVTFGGSAGTITNFNGSTTLIVTAPAGSGTVHVGVTNPAVNLTSPASSADQFTYAMNVTSVSPSSGPTTGGTTVDIKGQGFTGVTSVTFGNVPATNVTLVSDGEITAVSPAGSSGTVDVKVTTPSGTTASKPSDQFSYTAAGSAIAGLGVQLNGASPSPNLNCAYHANGNNTCSVTGVGCGGSVTFYVETVDGSGNPVVVTAPGGQGIAVGTGATPSNVTVPQGSFTTYAAPPGGQSVTAQLSPAKQCNKTHPESETVTLSTTINSNPVTLSMTVSSS
jgi:hypothetical protein